MHHAKTLEQITLTDAICMGCGCVCDDIHLTVQGASITHAANACSRGQAWFTATSDSDRPTATIAGQPIELDAALDEAARVLSSARYPLVYGLAETTCEAQGIAVAIADRIGASLDTTASDECGPAHLAFQSVGAVTCTLGEVKNRADLVIFWGCDPTHSHPRHEERYSTHPVGRFVPNGRAERTIVLVNPPANANTTSADVILPLQPSHDFEAVWLLRALVKGVPIDDAAADATGVSLAQWHDLLARMKRCRFGVIFVGSSLAQSRGQHRNLEALASLVRDLNQFTRFYLRSLRSHGNLTGADNVVTWQTGYPFGVSLHCGYPRYNPGEFTASALLTRGEPDAALIVASDPLSTLQPAARNHLTTLPYVALDDHDTPTLQAAHVAFTTAKYGINTAGTVYRMDEVALTLRPAYSSVHPSAEEILTRLEQRLRG